MPVRSGTDAAQEPSLPAAAEIAAGPLAGPAAEPAAGPGAPGDSVDVRAGVGAGSVWSSREYRALWAASGWSLVGDQLARVALTVLLFQATGSASAAALAGAATFLAPVVGGLLLSGIGDRWPRRQVLVACDCASAVLVAGMAIPGLPLWVMVVLLATASMLFAPFNAARMALTRDVFPNNQRYSTAIGTNTMTVRVAILLGALAGGAAVGLVGVRGALLLDASTFVASAVLVRRSVADRPAARPRPRRQPDGGPVGVVGQLAAEPAGSGLRLVFTDPVLRTSALYAWLAVFLIAPAGVAVLRTSGRRWIVDCTGCLLRAPGAGLASWACF